MKSTQKRLSDLLADFFTETELNSFLSSLKHGVKITKLIPQRAGRGEASQIAVQALDRNGLIGGGFFNRLIEERPGRVGEITEVQFHWMNEPTNVLSSSLRVRRPLSSPIVPIALCAALAGIFTVNDRTLRSEFESLETARRESEAAREREQDVVDKKLEELVRGVAALKSRESTIWEQLVATTEFIENFAPVSSCTIKPGENSRSCDWIEAWKKETGERLNVSFAPDMYKSSAPNCLCTALAPAHICTVNDTTEESTTIHVHNTLQEGRVDGGFRLVCIGPTSKKPHQRKTYKQPVPQTIKNFPHVSRRVVGERAPYGAQTIRFENLRPGTEWRTDLTARVDCVDGASKSLLADLYVKETGDQSGSIRYKCTSAGCVEPGNEKGRPITVGPTGTVLVDVMLESGTTDCATTIRTGTLSLVRRE